MFPTEFDSLPTPETFLGWVHEELNSPSYELGTDLLAPFVYLYFRIREFISGLFQSVTGSGGNTAVFLLVLALTLLGLLWARQAMRRRRFTSENAIFSPSEKSEDLPSLLAQALAAGDYTRAYPLRFQIFVLHCEEAGRLHLSPSTTASEAMRSLKEQSDAELAKLSSQGIEDSRETPAEIPDFKEFARLFDASRWGGAQVTSAQYRVLDQAEQTLRRLTEERFGGADVTR